MYFWSHNNYVQIILKHIIYKKKNKVVQVSILFAKEGFYQKMEKKALQSQCKQCIM